LVCKVAAKINETNRIKPPFGRNINGHIISNPKLVDPLHLPKIGAMDHNGPHLGQSRPLLEAPLPKRDRGQGVDLLEPASNHLQPGLADILLGEQEVVLGVEVGDLAWV
jgi:hypothetical protein